MKGFYILSIFSLPLISCQPEKESFNLDEIITYNKSIGQITIDCDDLKMKNVKINSINLKHFKDKSEQSIEFQNDHLVKKISHKLNLPNKYDFVNTWTSINEYGVCDYTNSYFFDLRIGGDDKEAFYLCTFPSSLFYGNETNRKYALVADYNEKFELSKKSKIDTIHFEDNISTKIPLKFKLGENMTRFILVDEAIEKNTLRQNKVYVTRKYTIK